MEDYSLISEYLKQNKIEKARKIIEKYYGNNLKLYFYYLGLSYCAEKDFNKAILFLCASKNHGLNNYVLAYNLGVAYLGKKEYESAEKYFMESVTLNKNFSSNYINLAYINLKKGDAKGAYRIIKSALTFLDDIDLLNIEKKLLRNLLVN
jgi:tetratricopeptide (TPR) repeat protein